MNNLIFKNVEKTLTNEDLKEFENKFSVKLPDDFTQHYMKYNGGLPNANWSDGDECNVPIELFLPIKYGENTIEAKMKEYADIGFNTQNKIVIASSKEDLYMYFLSLEEETFGQIFYRKNLIDIKKSEWIFHCENFNKFVEGLNYIGKKR